MALLLDGGAALQPARVDPAVRSLRRHVVQADIIVAAVVILGDVIDVFILVVIALGRTVGVTTVVGTVVGGSVGPGGRGGEQCVEDGGQEEAVDGALDGEQLEHRLRRLRAG